MTQVRTCALSTFLPPYLITRPGNEVMTMNLPCTGRRVQGQQHTSRDVPVILSSYPPDLEQQQVAHLSKRASNALAGVEAGKFDEIDLATALSSPPQKRSWAPRSRSVPRSWLNDESDDGLSTYSGPRFYHRVPCCLC